MTMVVIAHLVAVAVATKCTYQDLDMSSEPNNWRIPPDCTYVAVVRASPICQAGLPLLRCIVGALVLVLIFPVVIITVSWIFLVDAWAMPR